MTFLIYILVTIITVIGSEKVSQNCQNSSFDGENIETYSAYQVNTTDIIQTCGPLRCARECKLRRDCTQVIYDRTTLTCVLRTNEDSSGALDDVEVEQVRAIPHGGYLPEIYLKPRLLLN